MSNYSKSTEIVPLCLYHNENHTVGYIGFPEKIRKGDKTVLQCEGKQGMTPVARFYVFHTDLRPIPYGTALFCAKDTADASFLTTNLEIQYDPYNYEENCVSFITWVEPVPHTTPLYIFKSGQRILPTFSRSEVPQDYVELDFSPIYVLMHPNDKGYYRVHGESDKGFAVVDGEPQFRFYGEHRRCIPSPDGNMTLDQCMVLEGRNILQPDDPDIQPTLLTHLHHLTYSQSQMNVFRNISRTAYVIILALFLVIVFVLISN